MSCSRYRCRAPRQTANHEHALRSSGALDESSRNVQKASAHLASLISVDVGVGQRCRAKDCKSPSATLPTMSTRNVPAGQWNVTHGFDSREILPTARQLTRATVSISVGRWMKVQGKFKTQAHFLSCVVMNIAAFKVSHSSGTDIDATALRAARARLSSI